MARLKITRDSAEIEARLRQIITRSDPIDPKSLKAKLICIAGLAYRYNVDLGPMFFALIRSYSATPPTTEYLKRQLEGSVTTVDAQAVIDAALSDDAEDVVLDAGKKASEVTAPAGNVLDEMENN